MRYWHKKRHLDQCKRTEDLEIHLEPTDFWQGCQYHPIGENMYKSIQSLWGVPETNVLIHASIILQ